MTEGLTDRPKPFGGGSGRLPRLGEVSQSDRGADRQTSAPKSDLWFIYRLIGSQEIVNPYFHYIPSALKSFCHKFSFSSSSATSESAYSETLLTDFPSSR